MDAAGRLLARGRMADVFDVGSELVLSRYRNPAMDAKSEASAVTFLHEAGYPVPRVESVEGPGLFLERLDGPTMLTELTRRPWGLSACALLLADLHIRLSRIEAPAWSPTRFAGGTSMLHLHLHAGNVVLTASGPVVIDWTNGSREPGPADVANRGRCCAAPGPTVDGCQERS